MGFPKTHKIGQGMRVTVKGKSVDLIVRDIAGCVTSKVGFVDLIGDINENFLPIYKDHNLVLFDEVPVSIAKKNVSGKQITLYYHGPKDYKFDTIE